MHFIDRLIESTPSSVNSKSFMKMISKQGNHRYVDFKKLISGKYKLRESLYKSPGTNIWRASHQVLGGDYALKFAKTKSDAALTILHEAKVLSAFRGKPGVVQVIDLDQVGDYSYVLLEYIKGKTLSQKIETQAINESLVRQIALNAAKIVESVHKAGYLHLDIKNANFMQKEKGEVVLIDFGIAREIGAKNSPFDSGHGLSPHYASPEQTNNHELDERSDIYCLGAAVYELFTRRPPYVGEDGQDVMKQVVSPYHHPLPISSINKAVSSQMSSIVMKCLSKSPDQRYRTTSKLVEDLEALCQKVKSEKRDGIEKELSPSAISPSKGPSSFDEKDRKYMPGFDKHKDDEASDGNHVPLNGPQENVPKKNSEDSGIELVNPDKFKSVVRQPDDFKIKDEDGKVAGDKESQQTETMKKKHWTFKKKKTQ